MATTVLKNAFVSVNGVDLSDHVISVDCPWTADQLDSTTMGSNSKHSMPGLKDTPIKVTFRQDYAAAKIHATLWPLWNNQTIFNVIIKYDTGATSTENPSFTTTCWLKPYSPIKGSVGQLVNVEADFMLYSGDIVVATA